MTYRVLESKIFPITVFKTQVPDNNLIKEVLADKISLNSQYLKIPENWVTDRVKTSFESEPIGKELL
jgi:hypothetical protein